MLHCVKPHLYFEITSDISMNNLKYSNVAEHKIAKLTMCEMIYSLIRGKQ
jgi:hypothetical protein